MCQRPCHARVEDVLQNGDPLDSSCRASFPRPPESDGKPLPTGIECTLLNLGGVSRTWVASFGVLVGRADTWLAESLAASIDHLWGLPAPSSYHSLYTCSIGRSCYYGNALFLKTAAAAQAWELSPDISHTSKEANRVLPAWGGALRIRVSVSASLGSGSAFPPVSISWTSARHVHLGRWSAPIHPGPNFRQEMGNKKPLNLGDLGERAVLSTGVTLLTPRASQL